MVDVMLSKNLDLDFGPMLHNGLMALCREMAIMLLLENNGKLLWM